MRVAVGLCLISVLLAGCSPIHADQPSVVYCEGLGRVIRVLQAWPKQSMTKHQTTTTLGDAYVALNEAATEDFGGQTQLAVTDFSDDVRRLNSAIANGSGVDAAIAAIEQAIPSLPSCPGSPTL